MKRSIETAALKDKLEILKAKWLRGMMLGGMMLGGVGTAGGTITFKTTESRKDTLWQAVVAADPTKNKEYLNWMVRELTYANGWNWRSQKRYLEDLLVLQEELKEFDNLKKRNRLRPAHRDILKLDGPRGLYELLEEYRSKEFELNAKEVEKKLFNDKDATLVYDGPEWKIVIPHTVEASMFFGRNTRWCTAAKKNNMFNVYAKDGPLYIILEKKANKRWQLHLESDQLMDAMDDPIEDPENLRYTNQGLYKVIREHIKLTNARIDTIFKRVRTPVVLFSIFDVPLQYIKRLISTGPIKAFKIIDIAAIDEKLLAFGINVAFKRGWYSSKTLIDHNYRVAHLQNSIAAFKEIFTARDPRLLPILEKVGNAALAKLEKQKPEK